MKKAVFALAAAAAMSIGLAATPAWSETCPSSMPNLFGIADAGAFYRVTTHTPFIKTIAFSKTFYKYVYIHHHWKVIKVTKTFHKHVKGQTTGHHYKFSVGQYVGTSIAAAAVGEITQAVMTPDRQLTLSEAYQNAADAFLPFVGGWIVEQLMPDNTRTCEIARLAKEGKLSQEQALQAYTAAYNHHGH